MLRDVYPHAARATAKRSAITLRAPRFAISANRANSLQTWNRPLVRGVIPDLPADTHERVLLHGRGARWRNSSLCFGLLTASGHHHAESDSGGFPTGGGRTRHTIASADAVPTPHDLRRKSLCQIHGTVSITLKKYKDNEGACPLVRRRTASAHARTGSKCQLSVRLIRLMNAPPPHSDGIARQTSRSG